jgi:RimJ/RimL family protein N-acetyltransferase
LINELVPIPEKLEDNKIFLDNPEFKESPTMSVDFYKRVGFNSPWICYYAKLGDQFVGCAGYKDKPVDGKIKIAYGVFSEYFNKGIRAQIAAALVALSLEIDPAIIITARTLPEENFSTKILRKNNFKLLGTVVHEEDGELWGCEYERDFVW